MIGPQLRKALRWAAVIYILYSAAGIVGLLFHEANRPEYIDVQPWLSWMGALGGLASAAVQAGILVALLSIDERMEKRA